MKICICYNFQPLRKEKCWSVNNNMNKKSLSVFSQENWPTTIVGYFENSAQRILKVVNYNHLMPTRYSVLDISSDKFIVRDLKDPMKRKKYRFQVRVKFEERYKTGKNKWFFSKLRFWFILTRYKWAFFCYYLTNVSYFLNKIFFFLIYRSSPVVVLELFCFNLIHIVIVTLQCSTIGYTAT